MATPTACDFRDHHTDLQGAGADRVYGMSGQNPDYQAEFAERLRLPFAMLSDPGYVLADALRLPTFTAAGHERLYSRLTFVIRDGQIEHVFYPIFPPNTHAQQVLDWLRTHLPPPRPGPTPPGRAIRPETAATGRLRPGRDRRCRSGRSTDWWPARHDLEARGKASVSGLL